MSDSVRDQSAAKTSAGGQHHQDCLGGQRSNGCLWESDVGGLGFSEYRSGDVGRDLAQDKLRKKLALLKEALQGRFRPHHRFLLEQILSPPDFLDEVVEEINKEVNSRLRSFAKEIYPLMTIPKVDQKGA